MIRRKTILTFLLATGAVMLPQDSNQVGAAGLRELVQEIRRDLPSLHGKVDGADEVTQHLLNRLLVATDYALGCAVLGEAGLGPPLLANVRGLFENFIGTYWAAQADENGRVLLESFKWELTRVIKLNLREGHARIVHRATGQDRTNTFMHDARLAHAKRLPRVDRMSEEVGMKKIYDQFYGLLSLLTHAFGADVLANRDQHEMIGSNLHAAFACLRCIHLILSARITENRIVTRSEIETVMKIALA
jgi:hypothetical protein